MGGSDDNATAATQGATDPNAQTIAGPESEPGHAAAEDLMPFAEIATSNYRVAEEIARGGMGRIRVARDRRLGRWVALKEVIGRDAGVVRRFEREARIPA